MKSISKYGKFVLVFGILALMGYNFVDKEIKKYIEKSKELEHFQTTAEKLTYEPLNLKTVIIDGREIHYFELEYGGGYIFSTTYMANHIRGYGGPIEMAVFIDRKGTLKDLAVLKHIETLKWFEKTLEWQRDLLGINLYIPKNEHQVDMVTGATYTTRGILDTLAYSGNLFKGIISGSPVSLPKTTIFNFIPDPGFLLLILFSISAVIQRYFPKKWLRVGTMVLAIAVLGFVLNIQYSTYQVFSLFFITFSVKGLNISFFFYIILPFMVLLFGNFYCGYLCPFGLVQELVGDFFGRNKDLEDKNRFQKRGRFVKYIILALLILIALITQSKSFLKYDILQNLFIFHYSAGVLIAIGIILLMSIVSSRFWCRFLCPTGAFLSIMNGLSGSIYNRLRRFKGVKKARIIPKFNKCEYGVKSIKTMDCICCDKCRH